MSTRSKMAEFLRDKPGKEAPTGAKIYDKAVSLGLPPCVAQEWVHEVTRRAVGFQNRLLRKERKEASKFGAKRQDYRRIIYVVQGPEREAMFHATKGWRSYRRPA